MTSAEHVPPDDPRYDGFRITSLWVITGVDPADNQEGIVGGVDGLPLVASDEVRMSQLREMLPRLERELGVPLSIKRFRLVEETDD